MHNKINDINIFKLLFDSIKDSLDILINIFGIITFILIIINLLDVILHELRWFLNFVN